MNIFMLHLCFFKFVLNNTIFIYLTYSLDEQQRILLKNNNWRKIIGLLMNGLLKTRLIILHEIFYSIISAISSSSITKSSSISSNVI